MKKILITLFVTLFGFGLAYAGERSQGHSGRHQKYDTHTDEAGVRGRLGPIHFGVAVYAQHGRTANSHPVSISRTHRSVRSARTEHVVCTCEPILVYCSGCSRDCNPHQHRRRVCNGGCGAIEVQADITLRKTLYGGNHTHTLNRYGSRYPVAFGDSHNHRHNRARGYYRY